MKRVKWTRQKKWTANVWQQLLLPCSTGISAWIKKYKIYDNHSLWMACFVRHRRRRITTKKIFSHEKRMHFHRCWEIYFTAEKKSCAQVKENEWEISSYKLPPLCHKLLAESGKGSHMKKEEKHFQYQRSHIYKREFNKWNKFICTWELHEERQRMGKFIHFTSLTGESWTGLLFLEKKNSFPQSDRILWSKLSENNVNV